MQLKKLLTAFVIFILVNIGQISAQSSAELAKPDETMKPAETTEPKTLEKPKIEKPFRIGTGLGYTFLGYREETDLPLNRTLDTLNFNINGNIEKNNFYYTLNFGFLYGETKALKIGDSSYYQKQHEFLRMALENALDYRLWGNSVFPGFLGGALRADMYYSALEETNYSSFTLICSANLHATQKWIISDRQKLVFSASIPFFGYAIRPPFYGIFYSLNDMEKEFTSFHNYRAFFGDLKYHQKINEFFSFYLGLGFELSQITFPQERRDALFCMNAGFSYSF